MSSHHFDFLYTRVHKDLGSIPKDVKTLIFAMFVYVLAWGIIDPFMSIFIHNILQNYTLTGLFYGFSFLIGIFFSVPTGDLADKINKLRYTVGAMLCYPIIGLLYISLAFVHSSLVLVLLFFARILHGFSALFWIMVEGFIRSKAPKGETSATFGLYLTVHKAAFVVAPLFVIPIVLFFGINKSNVYWLLLALIPFPLLSAFIVSRIKSKGRRLSDGVKEVIEKDGVIKKEFADLKSLGFVGFFTLLIGFFIRSIDAIIVFLIPLYALSLNLGLVEISLIFALINLPYLFSFFFAEVSDTIGKTNVIALGFALAAVCLIGISLSTDFSAVLLLAAFGLGFVLSMLLPAANGLVTDITPRVQDGEMTGIYTTTLRISGFLTALLLGVLSDAFSLSFPFMVFAVALLAMAALTYSIKSKIVVRI